MAKEWWSDDPVVEDQGEWWASDPLVDEQPKKRTWGEVAEDTGRGLMSGAAGLVKSGGDLYGLATGNMDNAASQLGRNAQEHWESGQSQALKDKKDTRKAAIDAQEGIAGKAWEAMKGTVTDPALAADAVATNIATLIPGMAVGRLASGMKFASGVNAASKLGPANIPAIASAAGSFGTKAAIGAGAVQQGADVAGDVYESAMKKPDAAWAENPEFNQLVQASDGSKEAIQAIKHELALKAARLTLPAASAISVAANAIPGASMLERTLVGGAARETLEQGAKLAIPKAIAKGALGEMAQEGIEEGGGAFSGNVAKRGYVDPAQDLREGVGENAGMGMAGGFLLGGAGGAGHRVAPKPATGNTATATPAQPTSPPTLAIGNTPDPMIGFPDGTVARKSEVEAYIASLPEDQRTAARAGMMGLAQQPAKVDPVQSVMATSSVDDAIAAAQAAVADDQSDLSDLVQSESRNLQVLQAQIAQDRIKQEQLAQLHSQSVEALGRLPDQQVAAARAATDESPTAMQLAMQRAQEAAARPRAEPAQKLQPAPLGLENQPDPLIAFPDGSVARRGEVESYINSLPANQQTSARAKLMGFGQQKANNGTTDAVQPVPATGGGVASPVAPESVGTGTADGKRLGADAEGSGNSGLAEPGVRTNVDAAPALDQRLVPLSKRNVQNTAPRANPEAAKAAPVEAPAPARGQPVATAGLPGAGIAAVQPAGLKAKKTKGGQTLRATAYDRNPLMTFLATHGLYHKKGAKDSHKSEFSPDKGIMVMGYGPVFKATGKRLDVLTNDAIEAGYLPKDGTESQLRELVRRAVAGEKISPMYAEGVADNLAEQSYAEHLAQQQEASQDEDFDPFQPLSDLEYDLEDAANAGYDSASDPIKLEVNALLALAEDHGIDVDAIKEEAANDTHNDSEQAYYEAARNKLQAAIAASSGDSRSDAGSQGNADEQGSQEGLTAPTREDVLAQQDRAEQAEKDNAKAATDAANKAKADAEVGEFTLTGSDRAADVGAAGGQQDIFSTPAAEAPTPVDRFEVGRSLTKEQRKTVLATLVDVYKAKGAPRESKGQGRDGNDRSGYVHSPELFEKSDITGAMVRYYVTLPDGRIAHPSELFPDYTQSDINNEIERRSNAEKRNREIARQTYLDDTFDTKREAADFWNEKSTKSIKTAQGNPTVYDALDREFITDGSKFAMIPSPVLKNQDMMDAIKAEGWAPAEPVAQTAPDFTYINGDRAEYTGKTEVLHGGLFYEVKFTEGTKEGKTGVTQRAPDGTNPGQRGPEKSSGIVTPKIAPKKAEPVAQVPDTGSDIPPRYFKNVKVDHQVWIEDERKSETHKVSAKDALASIKEDLDNYKKLLQCMTKG